MQSIAFYVPIIGVFSDLINVPGNFQMYQFLSEPRLQLFFLTPNHCGAFLGVLGMLLTGIVLAAYKCKKHTCSASLGIVAIIVVVLIAKTYSRGVWVAIQISILIMTIRELFTTKTPHSLKFLLMPMVTFIAILLFTPHGAKRLASIKDAQTDCSIRNRIYIWRGGLGIIAKHPIIGVGKPPAVGNYFAVYYQTHKTSTSIYSLVNDYLTIAASFGLPLLFMILFILNIVLFSSFDLLKKTDSFIFLYAIMGIIVQAICCFFSTLYRFPEVFIPSIICVCIIFFFHWKKRTFPHLKIIIFSAILSITFCFVLYLLGVLVNIQAPCDVIKTKGEFVILPRRERGDITMLTSNAERDVRLFGRPLASRGFKVRLITTEGGIGEIKRLSQLFSHKDIPKSILLATEPELALLAVAVGKNIPFACVATANMPNHWPFEELSPLNAKKCRNHLELPIDSPESIIKHLIIYNTIK